MNMTEQNKEEILEIDSDQLQELLSGSDSDKLPPFEIDLSDYDVEEFKRGIKETSYLAGVITAILNTGVSESFVLDYLLSKETIAHNLKTAEINKEMNIEISKNHKAAAEKYEL
jgi:hypothetical protein